jgi:hypothetical protein
METKFVDFIIQGVSKEVQKITNLEKDVGSFTSKMNLAQNIKSLRTENDKNIGLFKESRKKRR